MQQHVIFESLHRMAARVCVSPVYIIQEGRRRDTPPLLTIACLPQVLYGAGALLAFARDSLRHELQGCPTTHHQLLWPLSKLTRISTLLGDFAAQTESPYLLGQRSCCHVSLPGIWIIG